MQSPDGILCVGIAINNAKINEETPGVMGFNQIDMYCPVAHRESSFVEAQPLTDAQHIVREAAVSIPVMPTQAGSVSLLCRERLGYRYRPAGRDDLARALVESEIESNVRRATSQAVGFRAVYRSIAVLTDTIGAPRVGTDMLPAEYDTPFGHMHTGEEAQLMGAIVGRVGRITTRTFGAFTMEQRQALQENFYNQTQVAALATSNVLNVKYGEWRKSIPKEVRESPFQSGLKDRFLLKHLGQLVNRSHILETSFFNAARSGAESGMIILRHFRNALAAARCPQRLWTPLAYANAAKLSLPASMAFWDAKQLHQIDVKEQSGSIFEAYQDGGEWRIAITHPKYERIYKRGHPAACQGAFILPPLPFHDHDKKMLGELHDHMQDTSQGLTMDTNYRAGTSAAQMMTLVAIATAGKEGYI